MKNKKIYQTYLIWIFLGGLVPYVGHSQYSSSITNPELIKGLASVPYTITNYPNGGQIRFIADVWFKIDYPACYSKQDTIYSQTDSTSWTDFQNNAVLSISKDIGSWNNSISPIGINVPPELDGITNAIGTENREFLSVQNPQQNTGIQMYFLNSGGPFTNDNNSYYTIQSVNRFAATIKTKTKTPQTNFCGNLIIEKRIFNVIAQFREKPNSNNPNPALGLYLCNGGGNGPQIMGGYTPMPTPSTSGGSNSGSGGPGGGYGGGSGGGGIIPNLCTCGPQNFQKIDVDWPNADEKYIDILCNVYVLSNGQETLKGITSSEGHFILYGLKPNDKIIVKSTKKMNGYGEGFTIYTSPQPDPIKINLSPNYVSSAPKLD